MRRKLAVLAAALCMGGFLAAKEAPGGDERPGREPGPGRMEAHPRHGLMGVLRRLDLSPEQKDKLKALRQARADKMKAAVREARQARQELEDLLVQPGASEKSLQELRRKQAAQLALQQKAETEAFEGLLEVRGLLSAEQLKRAAELMKEDRERPRREGKLRGERRPPRGPEGPDEDEEDDERGPRPPRREER